MSKNSKRKSSSQPRKPLTLQQVRKKVQQCPNDDAAWQALARYLLRDGELGEAQEAIERAVKLAPQEAEHLEWKGHIEYLRHAVGEALQSLEQAQEIEPDSVLGLLTLAKIHSEYGANAKALTYIERAEALAPKDIRVLDTKGAILNGLFRFEEAGEIFARLIKLDPGSFVHWNNAGNTFRDMGQLDEADRHYQKAIALDSNNPVAYSNRLTALHYDPEATRDNIAEIVSQWEKRYAPAGEFTRPVPNNREPARRLRIGMFSDGFRKHPVGKMIIRCLENLDPTQAELFAYSSSDVSDELTQRLKRAFHHWLPIRHLSDDAFAQRIRDDRIDILIDLSGHNAGNRMRVMAMTPAPLLVKWVGGLINTTGVQAIDYLISDRIETPAGEDAYYTEKLIRLPDDYIVFDPPTNLPRISELPAKRNGYITLACFNNPTKLNTVTLLEWAKVMHQLPDSRLLLKGRPYASEAFCERIYQQMEAGGIARERILIEGPGTNHELLEAYNQADIALDPWPYSGGLTTCEAFIMGLPVVTMTGPTFAGRHSATHLINAGMPELVTHSWEEYRAKVIELASDLDSLATIRQHLRDVLLQSPVCDGPRFARHFTQAMRAIWQRYCEGKAPAALSFDETGQVWFDGESAPLDIQYAEKLDDDNDGFNWQLPGKIIAIDNSARLLQQDHLTRLRRLKAFGIVAFDPASRVENPGQYQGSEDVQVFPHAVLGDGQPGTLYACLDPALSSTLEPLPSEQQFGANAQGAQVLTKLPINTIALDSINGLDSLDWLILDDLSDAATILEHGQKALQDTLLIQVRIAFQPTHQRQPNLAEMQHWMARHGFRFYRFNDQQHRSRLPESVPEARRQATELVSADALFLPSHERTAQLSDGQRTKLAFLLHAVFGVKDMAYGLLGEVDKERAVEFLEEEGLLKAKSASAGKAIEVDISSSKLSSKRKNLIQASQNNDEEKVFIHVCFNNMHVQPLINILNEKEATAGFQHTVFIEKSRSIPNYDVDVSESPNAFYFSKSTQFDEVLKQCLKNNVVGVFFHGLFFDWQKSLIKKIKHNKKIVWSIWGGDLYNPINEKKLLEEEIRYIDAITTVEIGDYNVFRKAYGEKTRLEFRYPGNVELSELHIPTTKKKRIIIGNSGDPSNNHIEIIKTLATKDDIKDYSLVIPMSYNSSPEHKSRVKKELTDKRLFGNVVILEKILPAKEYLELLAESEVLITAHRRQQAVGNLAASIYFGNKTILRKEFYVNNSLHKNPVWEALSEKEFPIIDFEDFKSLSSIKSIPTDGLERRDYNKSKIELLYGRQRAITLAKQAFLKIARL